jgi:hypothetical protein
MAEAVGPIFAAGFQQVTKSGYELLYLPDLHNDDLQKEGKAPVYWWLPNEVRLARRDGDQGDYKFSFVHFYGKPGGGGIDPGPADAENEVAGGLIAFSTTSSPPSNVLQEANDELLARFKGSDDKYWGWRTPVAPEFRPAPIVSNQTSVTNLSPNSDGTVPAPAPGSPTPPAAAGGAGGAPAGGPPGTPNRNLNGNGRPRAIAASSTPPIFISPKTTKMKAASKSSNLDMWYANIQGQGSGSVSPFAENAYSGLVGSLPAALIWSSFHGTTGGISVWQKLKIKVWSPVIHLQIDGDWDRIQAHFSAAAHYGALFWEADIQAQFNYLREQGSIHVKIEVDTTLPNADKLQEQLEKRSDLVFNQFMEMAKKTIFDPAPFNEKPAEASGGFLGFGGGVAFKLRVDMSHLSLHYDETREVAYLEEYPISGQLEGLYDVIKNDPTAEKKYFTTIYLSDWERSISRIVKPVVNWPDRSKMWVGEPVAFLSVQFGYPNADGVIAWDGHSFQSTDPIDARWTVQRELKKLSDVSNPPDGWTPDKTYVKRQVHFTEPPNESENPFVRAYVEKNIVDLDPGELGSLSNDVNVEVRADNVGALSVGPILLGADLETNKQFVEVTFQADGKTSDGNDRVPTKFTWQFSDQEQPRYWSIFTGQLEYIPRYKYQVRVVVKGSIFTAGMEWTGPWQTGSGNGPLMVSVPRPDDAGVTKRNVSPFAASTPAAAAPAKPAPAGPPPGQRSRDVVSSEQEVAGWTTLPLRSTTPTVKAIESPGTSRTTTGRSKAKT